MKRKWILFALLILVAYLLIAFFLFRKDPPLRYDHVNWPEKEWVVKRMAHHGIRGCIQDEKGYFFVREGRRCRL